MPAAWAGILCWQVVRKAGIFLLTPTSCTFPCTRCVSNLSCLLKLSALPGKSISGAQSVLCGQTHSPGINEPGTQHLGSRGCCDLVGGRPLPGEGHHCCCGVWRYAGCSAAPNWAVKHCRDPGCTTAPLLHSRTLQGCQDARCSVAPFLRQDVSEKVCVEGRIFSPFFKHHPENHGNHAKA